MSRETKIHKTDEKNPKHSFPWQEGAAEKKKQHLASTFCRLTLCIHVSVAAIVSCVKQFNWPFLWQTPDSDTCAALQVTQPDEASCAADKHHFHTFESKVSKLKEAFCSLSHRLHPEMKIPEQHTLSRGQKTPPPSSLSSVQHDWMRIIQNWFPSTLNNNYKLLS